MLYYVRMNQTPTITIPLSTAEKITQIGQAMLSLAEEMKKHARTQTTEPVHFPIPNLTRPSQIPAEQAWFWTEEWQKGEITTNEDMKAGHVSRGFSSVDELFTEFNRHV